MLDLVHSHPLAVIDSKGRVKHSNSAMHDLLESQHRVAAISTLSQLLSLTSTDRLLKYGIQTARKAQVWHGPVKLNGSDNESVQAYMSALEEFNGIKDCFALTLDQQAHQGYMNNKLEKTRQTVIHRVRSRRESASLVIETTLDGIISSVNAVASDALGLSSARLCGRDFRKLDCWHLNSGFEANFNRCVHEALGGERQRMPAKLVDARGNIVWMELSIAGTLSSDGDFTSLAIEGHDITTRVVNELNRVQQTQRLTQLSRKLLAAQEEERRRISQKLHDQIGQSLTALRLGLHNVQNKVDDESASSLIRENMNIVEQVLAQIRNLSLDLRPAMLDDLGLIAALEWFTARHSELTGLDLNFKTDLTGMRWSNSIEVACFRVAQEAIANAMRHSESPRIDVLLSMDGDQLELIIKDFGGGFCAEEVLERAAEGQSLGIVGMQQRIALVNGSIEFDSSDDHGTIVLVKVPID